MKYWYHIMSENLSPQELCSKYPEIKFYKLDRPPYSEWCYIYQTDPISIPYYSKDYVIYKDETGQILAFYNGSMHPIWYESKILGAYEITDFFRSTDDSVTVYDILTTIMEQKGFQEFIPNDEKENYNNN